jgi:hypothetical protein
MEIKYTIEILTKDIQDIEKLVGNLRNSKDSSAIELDLALSKLRNVYEILTLIKADRLHELAADSPLQVEQPEESAPTMQTEPEPEPLPELQAEPEPQPESQAEPAPQPETEAQTEAKAQAEPKAEPIQASDVDKQEEASGSSILAEKFSAESSINENMAEKLGNDTDAKLVGKPIDNISRNIGINDRFFIIRELFDGEADRFTSLVNELDSAEDYETASNILKQQLADHMDHEGVEILTGLLKRRFIR